MTKYRHTCMYIYMCVCVCVCVCLVSTLLVLKENEGVKRGGEEIRP